MTRLPPHATPKNLVQKNSAPVTTACKRRLSVRKSREVSATMCDGKLAAGAEAAVKHAFMLFKDADESHGICFGRTAENVASSGGSTDRSSRPRGAKSRAQSSAAQQKLQRLRRPLVLSRGKVRCTCTNGAQPLATTRPSQLARR
eukprot:1751223-Pleurochrysis_carterae.AAC.3